MLFTSLEFLLFFFPIVFFVNLLLPTKAKNVFLTLASFFFYAWGAPDFLPIMLASILFNYLVALPIGFLRDLRLKKGFLALAVVGNVALLAVFKYANLATSLLHRVFPAVYVTHFALPIGISFFTFQAMSYVIDVYRGSAVQKNPVYLSLYIALFPQLIAGPIVRYTDVEREIHKRQVSWEDASFGILRFLRGFNKKMILANSMGAVADVAFASIAPSVLFAWLGAVCYAFQIFFDFSGYSDMAIGLGRLLGFHFPENFHFPYISKTVTEFWRRWHMTLGGWFRDYLYFPLGGSRVTTTARLAFNLLLVWSVTGLWHGAGLNFLLWGFLYGVAIFIEKRCAIPKRVEEGRLFGGVYRVATLLLILVGWVLFRASDIGAAGQYVGRMLGLLGTPFIGTDFLFYASEYFPILVFCFLASLPLLLRLRQAVEGASVPRRTVVSAFLVALQVGAFWISLSMVVTDAHNPFIYFNF